MKAVKMVFEDNGYRATVTETMTGNLTGLALVEFAIDQACENLPEDYQGEPYLDFRDAAGRWQMTYITGRDLLANMLVSAEITNLEAGRK